MLVFEERFKFESLNKREFTSEKGTYAFWEMVLSHTYTDKKDNERTDHINVDVGDYILDKIQAFKSGAMLDCKIMVTGKKSANGKVFNSLKLMTAKAIIVEAQDIRPLDMDSIPF